ncbi:MAG: transporter substrate-binding domain-containing protein [Ancalomicrobiaceae bacterium]|nr:transporter substrate-binding domain-containing protein [Ancalomicrobiaceae bacterium]
MKSLVRLAAALALSLVVLASVEPVAVHAQTAPTATSEVSRLDAILARGSLRIGTTGDYRPFSYLDKATGTYQGYDIDVGEALAGALGVKAEFVATSWPKMMEDFSADKFDIAMGGVSITLPRQKKGYFSTPIMREGKTPIARCADHTKFQTVADLNQPSTHAVVNPGGTNEAFARANFPNADIRVYADNTKIFDEIAAGKADVMVTDSSETLYQQKLHAGVLCSIHPDKPFDFAEKAYWMQRDVALKAFVDQFLHISAETGKTKAIYAKWFE